MPAIVIIALIILGGGALSNADMLFNRATAKNLAVVLILMFACVVCSYVGGGNGAELLK